MCATHLRVPDGAKGRNSTALHGVDEHASELRVADDEDRLGTALPVQVVRELDHIRAAHGLRIPDQSIGVACLDRVADFLAVDRSRAR